MASTEVPSQLAVFDMEPSQLAGHIESISLENFMCHENFMMNFNPRINFIVGANGSGKSAIQMAICLVLGMRSNATQRGNSFKDFIKHDCDYAIVKLTLSNRGENSYHREICGKRIVVERRFTERSSTYKIYKEDGRLLASKRSVLDEILYAMRIKANNPIAILNQSMAKSFLNATTSHQKYALFCQSTNLDDVEKSLKYNQARVAEQQDVLSTKEDSLSRESEELREMIRRNDLANKLKKLKARLSDMRKEIVWSRVFEKSDSVERLKNERTRLNLMIEDNEKKIVEYESNIANDDKRMEEIRKELSDKRSHLTQIESQVAVAKANANSVRNEYLRKNKMKNSMKADLAETMSDAKKIEMNLAQTESHYKDIQRRREEAILEKSQRKEQLSSCEEQLNVLILDKTNMRHTLDTSEQEVKALISEVANLNTRIRENERGIADLKKGNNDVSAMRAYGDWMPDLVKAIDSAHARGEFTAKPVGPFLRYIKVKNAEWSSVIERILWPILGAFVVTNVADRKKLFSIMEKIRNVKGCQVFCGNFPNQVYDVTRNETCSGQYTNLFRAIDISNGVVANCVIDSLKPECTLLVNAEDELMCLMETERNVPRNCLTAYNLLGDKFRPAPNYGMYCGPRYLQGRVLLKDESARKIGFEQENADLMKRIDEINAEIANLREKVVDLKTQESQIANTIRRKEKERFQFERIVEKLEATIAYEAPTLKSRMDELEELQRDVASKKTRLEEATVECARLSRECEEADAKVKELEDLRSNCENLDALKAELRKREKKKGQSETFLDSKRRRIGALNKDVQKNEEQIQSEEEILRKYKSEAIDVVETYDRPVEFREASRVAADIKRAEKQMNAIQAELGENSVNIGEEMLAKQRHYDKLKAEHDKLKDMVYELKRLFKDRQKKADKVRENVAKIISKKFNEIMLSRNYNGRIIFNHEKQTLDIQMPPIDGHGSSGDAVSRSHLLSSQSLSGGERSYATIGFIMALWSYLKLPFTSMDEFDVFMDGVNRDKITNLLMSCAQATPAQYIFLTPLDLSNVKYTSNVTIHRVRDPKRKE